MSKSKSKPVTVLPSSLTRHLSRLPSMQRPLCLSLVLGSISDLLSSFVQVKKVATYHIKINFIAISRRGGLKLGRRFFSFTLVMDNVGTGVRYSQGNPLRLSPLSAGKGTRAEKKNGREVVERSLTRSPISQYFPLAHSFGSR